MRYLTEYKKYNIPKSTSAVVDINDIWKDVNHNEKSFENIMKSLIGCRISFECERCYNPPDFKKDHSCWYYKTVKNPPPQPTPVGGLQQNPNYKFVKATHYGVVEDVNVSFKKSHHTGRYTDRKNKGFRALIKFKDVMLYHRLDETFQMYDEPNGSLKTYLTTKQFDL